MLRLYLFIVFCIIVVIKVNDTRHRLMRLMVVVIEVQKSSLIILNFLFSDHDLLVVRHRLAGLVSQRVQLSPFVTPRLVDQL